MGVDIAKDGSIIIKGQTTREDGSSAEITLKLAPTNHRETTGHGNNTNEVATDKIFFEISNKNKFAEQGIKMNQVLEVLAENQDDIRKAMRVPLVNSVRALDHDWFGFGGEGDIEDLQELRDYLSHKLSNGAGNDAPQDVVNALTLQALHDPRVYNDLQKATELVSVAGYGDKELREVRGSDGIEAKDLERFREEYRKNDRASADTKINEILGRIVSRTAEQDERPAQNTENVQTISDLINGLNPPTWGNTIDAFTTDLVKKAGNDANEWLKNSSGRAGMRETILRHYDVNPADTINMNDTNHARATEEIYYLLSQMVREKGEPDFYETRDKAEAEGKLTKLSGDLSKLGGFEDLPASTQKPEQKPTRSAAAAPPPAKPAAPRETGGKTTTETSTVSRLTFDEKAQQVQAFGLLTGETACDATWVDGLCGKRTNTVIAAYAKEHGIDSTLESVHAHMMNNLKDDEGIGKRALEIVNGGSNNPELIKAAKVLLNAQGAQLAVNARIDSDTLAAANIFGERFRSLDDVGGQGVELASVEDKGRIPQIRIDQLRKEARSRNGEQPGRDFFALTERFTKPATPAASAARQTFSAAASVPGLKLPGFTLATLNDKKFLGGLGNQEITGEKIEGYRNALDQVAGDDDSLKLQGALHIEGDRLIYMRYMPGDPMDEFHAYDITNNFRDGTLPAHIAGVGFTNSVRENLTAGLEAVKESGREIGSGIIKTVRLNGTQMDIWVGHGPDGQVKAHMVTDDVKAMPGNKEILAKAETNTPGSIRSVHTSLAALANAVVGEEPEGTGIITGLDGEPEDRETVIGVALTPTNPSG